MPKTIVKKNKARNNGARDRAKVLRAKTSAKFAQIGPTLANVKYSPGDKLTGNQRVQLKNAGRDIHGNIDYSVVPVVDYQMPLDPIEVKVESVEIVMTSEQFDALKAEAKKKKRGFQKYAESKGWQLVAEGGDPAIYVDWFRVA